MNRSKPTSWPNAIPLGKPFGNLAKLNTRLLIALVFLTGLHQAASQSFVLSSSPSAYNPVSIIAADVNGDGKQELICANASVFNTPSTVSVFTNDGSGRFGISSQPTVGVLPISVVAADVNGDGKLDLICANEGDNKVSVLTNGGSGGFKLAGTYAAGHWPSSVAAADINGDGKVDLIIADNSSLNLTVLTNDGVGGFMRASYPNVGSGPISVTAADVNRDKNLELICANYGGNSISVLTNNGGGVFKLASSSSTGNRPSAILAVDVNGDGWVDLITANENESGTLTVLTNNRSGSFGSNSTLNVGGNPTWVATADVNGDGKIELISANNGVYPSFNGSLSVLTNNGNGSFALAATLSVGSGAQSVVAVDVNGDGRLDLVSANYSGGSLSVLTNSLTFLPRLTLKNSGTSAVVSWPSQWTGWAGWTLQQNTDLNTGNWTSFKGTIGDDGTTKSVTNSPQAGNLFFRLAHP